MGLFLDFTASSVENLIKMEFSCIVNVVMILIVVILIQYIVD